MALRQLVLTKKIEALRAQLAGMDAEKQNLTERRDALNLREQELTQAVQEVTAETPEEDKAALESATEEFTHQAEALEKDENEHEEARAAIEQQISSLQQELDALNARASSVVEKKENRKDEIIMDTRAFFGMTHQERDALFARQDVKDFMQRLRRVGEEKRAITNSELVIPDVFLGLIREKTAESSKLLKHVSVRRVGGTSRMTIAGSIPEAVWTEMCAKLNELSIGFNNVEMDGYKVGGYIPVCNALLEDSDPNLATEIITMLGKAIGLALDKAILYGTGTKMPLGIVTRLAQTAKPSDYPVTARPWADLHTANLTAVASANQTGVKLFQAIVTAFGKAKNKYAIGDTKFWAMNETTQSTLITQAMTINAAGMIVTGQSTTMPIIGGAIETLDFIPDGVIIGGYGNAYVLAERAGTAIAQSEHYRFVEDQTVFKATARYDGMPVIPEAFVGIGISGTAPAADAVIFAADTANEIVSD